MPRSLRGCTAPVKEGRLGVQWQRTLRVDQKANKCWMHTVPEEVDVWEAMLGEKSVCTGPTVAVVTGERRVGVQTPIRQVLATAPVAVGASVSVQA
jgi:hypothetical protein